jgi:hypothetical protein
VKYGISEGLHSNVDIAMLSYGTKKELGQIHIPKIHLLESVVKMGKSNYQQDQHLLLSFRKSTLTVTPPTTTTIGLEVLPCYKTKLKQRQ